MLTRIGRAAFHHTLKEQSALVAVAGMALKALPNSGCMELVVGNATSAANKRVNHPSHLDEEADAYWFSVEECPCWRRPPDDKPDCFATVEVLQEAMVWTTNKDLRLEEVACMSNGASASVPHLEESVLSRIDQRVPGLSIPAYDWK